MVLLRVTLLVVYSASDDNVLCSSVKSAVSSFVFSIASQMSMHVTVSVAQWLLERLLVRYSLLGQTLSYIVVDSLSVQAAAKPKPKASARSASTVTSRPAGAQQTGAARADNIMIYQADGFDTEGSGSGYDEQAAIQAAIAASMQADQPGRPLAPLWLGTYS
jgi:hypothetical protein